MVLLIDQGSEQFGLKFKFVCSEKLTALCIVLCFKYVIKTQYKVCVMFVSLSRRSNIDASHENIF